MSNQNANTIATTGTMPSHTYTRHELFLGAVQGVMLAPQRRGQRVIHVSYELNIIDGWVRTQDCADADGVTYNGTTTRKSHVGAVLDAAPDNTEFVARSHLAWLAALHRAGHHTRARQQRRALDHALHRHGLAVRDGPPQQPSS